MSSRYDTYKIRLRELWCELELLEQIDEPVWNYITQEQQEDLIRSLNGLIILIRSVRNRYYDW